MINENLTELGQLLSRAESMYTRRKEEFLAAAQINPVTAMESHYKRMVTVQMKIEVLREAALAEENRDLQKFLKRMRNKVFEGALYRSTSTDAVYNEFESLRLQAIAEAIQQIEDL